MNSSRFFFFPKAKQKEQKKPRGKKGNKLRNRIREAKQSKWRSENVPQKPSKLKFQLPRGKKPDEKMKMNKAL